MIQRMGGHESAARRGAGQSFGDALSARASAGGAAKMPMLTPRVSFGASKTDIELARAGLSRLARFPAWKRTADKAVNALTLAASTDAPALAALTEMGIVAVSNSRGSGARKIVTMPKASPRATVSSTAGTKNSNRKVCKVCHMKPEDKNGRCFNCNNATD
jgi:hypothetical protein